MLRDKVIETLKYIDTLYKDGENVESLEAIDVDNPELYGMWKNALESYTLEEIKSAVRRFWTYKNDRTAPKVAQLLVYLQEDHKDDAIAEENKEQTKGMISDSIKNYIVDPAITQRLQDIADGNCHHNMPDYNEALKLILDQYLPLEVPAAVYAKMGWEAKIKEAKRRGLLGRFNEALKAVSMLKRGREYEFMSANDELALAKDKIADMPETLASHWMA